MSDELSVALRELAAARATAPIVGGPATRVRAMRRRRRRRAAAALGAGTAALALLGFALTLQLGEDPDHPAGRRTSAVPPSVSASRSAATPMPVPGTLDLPGSDLTFDGRVMRILSKIDLPPGSTSTTSMTVVAKPVRMAVTVEVPSKGSAVVDVAHAVELRDGEGGPLYVGALAPDIRSFGDHDARGGVIGLSAEDAQWFYARIRLGASISVTTGSPPTVTPPTVTPSAPDPSAPDLSAPDLSASDLSASDLSASDLSASDLSASDLSAPAATASPADEAHVAAANGTASPVKAGHPVRPDGGCVVGRQGYQVRASAALSCQ
ncbi:hypothetical protein M2271_006127 [Streptomyces sp. LBL]|uniref:hypothetical protein n=1 Tax=Streptomyces sp. LBL TaxID=2940562 RepID=UPI002476BD39|nr:hypothetical protein [Streptomyces sp. LBL]MDH6628295.1 hypothetical protein [Streptomyces sp. LBL]